MNVAIRCDASHRIGTGHVMRCLTLADQLRARGGQVTFVSREHLGNMNDYVTKHGYEVHRLTTGGVLEEPCGDEYARWLVVSKQQDAQDTISSIRKQPGSIDWLIVDHYGLDESWERKLRPFVGRIMVIDDLANRRHDCDLLLDQNYYEDCEHRYEGLTPSHCIMLLGPEHVLLREEFIQKRPTVGKRHPPIERVLIFFGGADRTDQTSLALDAVPLLARDDIRWNVVLGSVNLNGNKIIDRSRSLPHVTCHVQVDNMAELMADADLALAAGGTTIYERMYLKLPSLAVSVAANQTPALESLNSRSYLRYLGEAGAVTAVQIAQAIRDFERDGLEVREFEFNQRIDILWSQLQDCPVAR